MFEEFLLPGDLSRRELIDVQKTVKKRLRKRSSVSEILFLEATDKLQENWARLSSEDERKIIEICSKF